MRKFRGIIFSIIALVIISLTIISPWWVYNVDWMEGEFKFKYEFHKITVEIEGDKEDTASYSELSKVEQDNKWNQIGEKFHNTFIIITCALILTILFTIFIILSILQKINNKNFILIFGILAVIFTILAPIYLMVTLPGVMWEDEEELNGFWGSKVEEDVESEIIYGAGLGWYFAILGMIFNVGAVITLLKSFEEKSNIDLFLQK